MEDSQNERVPEPLRGWNLSVDEILVAQTIQSCRDRNIPPEIVFQLYELNLICRQSFRKVLSQSDVDGGQDRFLIPRWEAENYILPFLNATEKPSNGISITVYDTDGGIYPLCFLQRKDGKFIITHTEPEGTHWRHVCQSIELNTGSSIKLWTVRHVETNQLSFVIEKVPIEEF